MVLQFLCPNGHRIHCGDERAGKAAKCPRCGVQFLVPTVSAEPQAGPPRLPSGPTTPALPAKTEAAPGDEAEPQIEYLCPAGHHLQSPASLQGQPGECPTCGSRFYIPSYEKPHPYEEPHPEPGENSSIRVHEGRPEGVSDVPSDSRVPLAFRMAEATHAPAGQAIHPIASLFDQLWARKSHGQSIELHLADGEVLRADRYSTPTGSEPYGLFAVQEPDGSFTLTAIAWSSIERITMRGLKQLPDDLRA